MGARLSSIVKLALAFAIAVPLLASCSQAHGTQGTLADLTAALGKVSTHGEIPPVLVTGSSIQVGFSPGNAESLVVATINHAKRSIMMAAYSFTSRPIATALVNAHARGVNVQIVVDKSQQTKRYTSAAYVAKQGIPVRTDSHYKIMHNKFLVIDGSEVETGSFNYTKAATLQNAENVMVVSGSPRVASIYATEWHRLWNESTPYVRGAASDRGDRSNGEYHKRDRDYDDRRHYHRRWY